MKKYFAIGFEDIFEPFDVEFSTIIETDGDPWEEYYKQVVNLSQKYGIRIFEIAQEIHKH
jgi:hypothetical protein